MDDVGVGDGKSGDDDDVIDVFEHVLMHQG